MGTAPAALRAAITTDHFPQWSVTLIRPDGSSIPAATVVGGTVTKDAGAWPRTRATLVCALPTLTPAPLDDAFLPFGSRARFRWSVQGVTGSVLVADLLIVGTSVDRPAGTVTLTCADDSAQIDTVGFDIPSDSGPAKSATAFVTWAAQWARPITWPALVVAGSLPAGTIPTIDTTGISSAWSLIEQIATGVGGEAWFDAQRRLRLRAVPTPGTPAGSVARLAVGPGGTVTGYLSTLNRGPNAVYVRFGAGDDWGFWFDTDPTSPTFYDGTTMYGWVEDRTGPGP